MAVEIETKIGHGVQPSGRLSEGLPSGWTPKVWKRFIDVNAERQNNKNKIRQNLKT